MSFDIYAPGLGDFLYERRNCLDQEVFELETALGVTGGISSASTPLGRVAAGGHGYIDQSAATSGMNAIGNMQAIHTLGDGITQLSSRSGTISVSLRRENMVFDDSGFMSFSLDNHPSPGRTFMRYLLPKLDETDFNSFGVIFEISRAVAEYNLHTTRVMASRRRRRDSPLRGNRAQLLIQISDGFDSD